MPNLVDIGNLNLPFNIGRKTSLDADKMRRHILECLGTYLALFSPRCTLFSTEDSTIEENYVKSKIFLSAVQLIAASALADGKYGTTSLGSDIASHHLICDEFLTGVGEIQLESDGGDWLPLHWAGVIGEEINANGVRAVLEYSSRTTTEKQASALHYAVISSEPNYSAIKEMSSQSSFLRKDSDEELPVHWVARYSHSLEMLQYISARGPSSLAKQNSEGQTPLQCLVLRDYFDAQLSMVSHLAEYELKNVAATVTTDGKATALHTYCQRDYIADKDTPIFHELLRLLPDAAKSLDAEGALPLHYAVSKIGHWDTGVVCELMKHYKEGTTTADGQGRLPIHYLLASGPSTIERLNLLIDANPASASAKTSDNKNLLHCAVDDDAVNYVNLDVIEAICKLDPSAAQAKDVDGNLPLHLACKNESLRTIEALYAHYPAAISELNRAGMSPLCWSTRHKSEYAYTWRRTCEEAAILRFLLRHSPVELVQKQLLKYGEMKWWPILMRRLLLRADPTARPDELRKLNYAERRMAMFLIFSALSKEPDDTSLVHRLRSLAFDYGPDMCLIKAIVSFL